MSYDETQVKSFVMGIEEETRSEEILPKIRCILNVMYSHIRKEDNQTEYS